MPSNHRQTIQRRLDQAAEAVFRARAYIIAEGEQYKDIHPDYFYMFQGCADYLEEGIKFIISLRDKI